MDMLHSVRALARALALVALSAGLGCSADDGEDAEGDADGSEIPGEVGDGTAEQELQTFTPDDIVTFDALLRALTDARGEDNGGFDLDMWATVVDREGVVVAVAFSGATEDAQWPGSRVISAQKRSEERRVGKE